MSDLPPSWTATTMGEVCEVVGGSTPKTSLPEYWGGEIAWITPDDLSKHAAKHIEHGARFITRDGYESCSTRMMPAGSVVFTSRAPIGYVAIASQPVCTNQGFKSFVPPAGVLSDYLYWYLRFATPQIRDMGSGTTFKEISGKVAKIIPLLLPPTNEQRRIVEAIEEQFSRLDAGVESLERARRNLALLKASVLRAAVEGKVVPHDPSDEPAKALLAQAFLPGLHPGSLHGSAANGCPVGWEPVTLGELLEDIEAGRSFGARARPAEPEEWGVIKVSAMTWGRFRDHENKAVPPGARVEPRFEIRPGDLLLSRANTADYVGATVLVEKTRPRLLLSDKSMRLKPLSTIDRRWLLLALSSPPLRAQMSAVATGTSDSMRNISQDKVRRLSLWLPPASEQRRIVAEVERQFSIVDAMEYAIEGGQKRARGLRQAILREAFTGRLAPQDPSDEPASALLERIRGQRVGA